MAPGPSTRLPQLEGRTAAPETSHVNLDFFSDRGAGARLPRAHRPKETCEGRSLRGDK